MSNNNSNFQIALQAILDKIKSIANIKADIKVIEAKLPKVKLQGTLLKTATRKELNEKLKTINPKVKIDADTTQAEKKIKKIGRQKRDTTITPKVDNTQVVSGLKQAQKETKTLWERFMSGAIGVNLVRMSVQKVTQAIHEAISAVKELDAIKTNIQMVSGSADLEVNAMMKSYNSMAKNLSSTTKDVAEAANEFLRMGESIENTNELIKSSQVLSKVGMIESSEAASYLISSLKGYQIAAENSMDVVSKLTSVDLEAAVSAGGLAEAISRCANIANNSGTSMDRLIGYAATIGEVTQESMSVVGNSMKTLYSRYSNLKINRFTDDESGESLSDVETVLNKLGIKLRETENTYRNFDDVLDDIANRWENLTQVERNAVSVAIAGTMQRNRFLVLMDNYAKALDYSAVAANSAGNALERYGIYQDSIEAKTNELTAAMESLSTNVISEELYSGIIEATTRLVEFLDKTNLLKASLAGLVALGVSKAIASIGAGFITAAKSTAQLSAAMKLFDKGTSIANLQSIGAACIGLNNNQLKLILSTKGLRTEQRLKILEGMGMEEQERQQTLITLGFAEAEDKATFSTFSLKGAFRSLWTVIATNPIGVIVTAVSVATMVFTGFNRAMEEARQKAKDLGDSFKSTKSDIESYKSQIEELHKTINNSNSSIEDVTNARKSLLSIQNELIDKFGTEKSVINDVTEAINGQTGALDRLTNAKWQETKNEFNNGGFWNAVSNSLGGYSNNIDRMLEEYGNYVARIRLNDFIDVDSIDQLEEFKSLLKNNFDAEITFDVSDGNSEIATLSGNASEIYEKLLDIQNLADQFHFNDSFENKLTKLANSAKEASNQYKDFYDQYILYEKILTDGSNYADTFKDITDAYEEYRNAFTSGEESKIKEATESYANILTNAASTAISNGDSDVATYFENMYPQLQSIVESWKFNVAFDANTDDLQGKIQSVLDELHDENGRTLTAEEILGLSKANEQYQALVAIAHTYNMSIEEMIELLKERNLVSAMDYQGLVGLFGQENVDKLSSEDLEIAYTIKNVGNMTFEKLQAEIQKTKEYAKKNEASFSLTDTQTKSIDDFQSKIKTLTDTLTSINKGTFESSDITDLLQEFPELEGETDNLQDAIQKLIQTLLNNLYSVLGENIPPELKESLQAIADKAINASLGIKTLSDAISDVQSIYDLMQTVSEEIANGGISASTLQNITSKYPQLENAVNAYCAGLLTEHELYEQLETQYQKDYEAFQTANQSKIYENEIFFEKSYEKNGELVNALAKKYKLDLDNFKTVEDAKLLGETKLLGKLASMWSNYYEIVIGKDGLYHIQQLNSGYDIDNDHNYIALEETRVKMQEFLDDLNESFDLGNLGLDDTTWNIGKLDKASSSASDSAKDTAETFDWLETKIARCTEALEKYTDTRDNAFTTYGTRNNALAKEIEQTQELITLHETAARKYGEYADSFGLSDHYKQLVQSGAVDIESITDETLKEQIQNYKEWYDKALKSRQAVDELKRSLSELAQTNFNMITSEFEDVLSAFETRAKSINNAISLTEAKGYAVSTRYYQALIEDETENISLLKKEHETLTKSLNEAVDSGRIKEGSEAWYDMHSSISDVSNAIEEANISLVEFQNTIRDLKWDVFDRLQDTISQITDESEFIIDLFSNEEMFDDKGIILNTGLATAGQHAVNYNVLMAQADDYADEYKSVMEELADDPYNQTLIDRTRELAQAQRDAIKSAQDEKQALIELAREGIQKEINAMQKLVDIKKKMLNADTSLYEYEQDVARQSENIASIEKQIAAVQGDNSEENMKRLQQLNKELAEAEKQLRETEYDRWKSDQQDMLDEMMSEYEELQNERMNETEKLFREYMTIVNANYDIINSTVTQTTEALGYTLSGEMQEIWDAQSMQNGEYQSIVSGYGDGFENQLTSVNEVLNGIKEANREAMDSINSEAVNTTSEIANVGRKIEQLAHALLNATSPDSSSIVIPDNLNNGNGISNAEPDNASSPAARESTNDNIPNIGDKVYAKGNWYGDSNGGGAESNVDILKPSYYRIAHIASSGAKYGYNIQGYDENDKPTRGNGWVNLDQLAGYAKGTKKATEDWAWTQEDGGEIIRTSDGALLTPVKDSMVFSNEATRRLWEIANVNGEFPEHLRELFDFPSYKMPQLPVMNNNISTSNVKNGDVHITMEMNLPNVHDYKELRRELINDRQFEKAIQAMTVDLAAGKHPMAKYRYV